MESQLFLRPLFLIHLWSFSIRVPRQVLKAWVLEKGWHSKTGLHECMLSMEEFCLLEHGHYVTRDLRAKDLCVECCAQSLKLIRTKQDPRYWTLILPVSLSFYMALHPSSLSLAISYSNFKTQGLDQIMAQNPSGSKFVGRKNVNCVSVQP